MNEKREKWTNGPWEIDDWIVQTEASGVPIASVYETGDFPCLCNGAEQAKADIELQANAHLIAAAPEMYEALANFVLSSITDADSCPFCRRDGDDHAEDCPCTFAINAMKKARGDK